MYILSDPGIPGVRSTGLLLLRQRLVELSYFLICNRCKFVMNEIADLVLIAWVPPLFQENLIALEFGLCEQVHPNHGFLFQAR